MSASSTGTGQVIYLYARDTIGLDTNTQANRAGPVMVNLDNYMVGGLSGANLVDAVTLMPNTSLLSSAFATLTYASSSGTVGVIVNGVSITVTWATDDATSMAATVTAFNASTNALIQGIVKMGYAGNAQVVCSSVAAGDTVTLSGITLTAVAGTRAFRQFSKDTSNTATGDDLCLAINQDPVLGNYWAAVNSSGTVKIYPRFPTATAPIGIGSTVLGSSSNTTLAVTALAAGATAAVCACLPGVQGNSISLIATGTNASIAATASPGTNYASGNKLLAGGSGANSAASTAFYGRLP